MPQQWLTEVPGGGAPNSRESEHQAGVPEHTLNQRNTKPA